MTTFDLAEVRIFAAGLDARQAGCNGEGTYCSDLDAALGCHVEVCEKLREAVDGWAREVFSGRIGFDPEVEHVFKHELLRVLNDVRPLAEHGREVATDCFSLERLADLESYVAEFTFLLKNWVSPQKSVAPAARVSPDEEADKQIRDQVSKLPPLPEGWRPKDRRQARIFDQPPTS